MSLLVSAVRAKPVEKLRGRWWEDGIKGKQLENPGLFGSSGCGWALNETELGRESLASVLASVAYFRWVASKCCLKFWSSLAVSFQVWLCGRCGNGGDRCHVPFSFVSRW